MGVTLLELMKENGWRRARRWARQANAIAPTIVGGSKKHGGADLGPSGARKAWATLSVDGRSVADEAPGADFVGMPRLTIPMVQRLQGFPDVWMIEGGKTQRYRQIGNAFPPAVAEAFARQIRTALSHTQRLPGKVECMEAAGVGAPRRTYLTASDEIASEIDSACIYWTMRGDPELIQQPLRSPSVHVPIADQS